MLFDAQWHGFRVFDGVPGRGIYDNMKTAVDRVGRSKERQVNMRFLAMTNHCVFALEFCNPAASWEKGQVEKSVDAALATTLRPTGECLWWAARTQYGVAYIRGSTAAPSSKRDRSSYSR